jgi:hypothetical protein
MRTAVAWRAGQAARRRSKCAICGHTRLTSACNRPLRTRRSLAFSELMSALAAADAQAVGETSVIITLLPPDTIS